jgi:hypothetical protein
MKQVPSKGIMLAFSLAVMMHLLLFVSALPSDETVKSVNLSPPQTHYAMPDADGAADESTIRMLKSPVLSSLPSALGFSGELLQHDVQNPKKFTPLSVPSAHFLELSSSAQHRGERLNVKDLMISAAERGPGLPADTSSQDEVYPVGKRVQLAPALQGRLEGGIVLPSGLNQETDTPWMVHAEISISEQGIVEHVFLEQPLESVALNQQVLQVLYSLNFKAGAAQQSSIEIYSPMSARGGGKAQ